MTGVPVSKVIRSEAKYLINLAEKTIGKYVSLVRMRRLTAVS